MDLIMLVLLIGVVITLLPKRMILPLAIVIALLLAVYFPHRRGFRIHRDTCREVHHVRHAR